MPCYVCSAAFALVGIAIKTTVARWTCSSNQTHEVCESHLDMVKEAAACPCGHPLPSKKKAEADAKAAADGKEEAARRDALQYAVSLDWVGSGSVEVTTDPNQRQAPLKVVSGQVFACPGKFSILHIDEFVGAEITKGADRPLALRLGGAAGALTGTVWGAFREDPSFLLTTSPKLRPTAPYRAAKAEYRRLARRGSPESKPASRWLVVPSHMGGDLWHIAAALKLDPRLQVLMLHDEKQPKAENATSMINLLHRLRLLKFSTTVDAHAGQRVHVKNVKERPTDDKSPGLVSSGKLLAKSQAAECGHYWAATSLLVCQALRDRKSLFAHLEELYFPPGTLGGDGKPVAFGKDEKDAPPQVAGLSLNTLSQASFVAFAQALEPTLLSLFRGLESANSMAVLVNMRFADAAQNNKHDTGRNVFESIAKMAAAYKIRVVRVGVPDLTDDEGKARELATAPTYLTERAKGDVVVDFYQLGSKNGKPVADGLNLFRAFKLHKILHAYFWHRVARWNEVNKRIVGLIGGRSGGIDIASQMGLRSASVDEPKPTDHHYMRLHWTSPLMSIIAGTQHGVDAPALAMWLSGLDLVPILPGDPHDPFASRVSTAADYCASKKGAPPALSFHFPEAEDAKVSGFKFGATHGSGTAAAGSDAKDRFKPPTTHSPGTAAAGSRPLAPDTKAAPKTRGACTKCACKKYRSNTMNPASRKCFWIGCYQHDDVDHRLE